MFSARRIRAGLMLGLVIVALTVGAGSALASPIEPIDICSVRVVRIR